MPSDPLPNAIYNYLAYGLPITSETEFDGLLPSEGTGGDDPVCIKLGPVPTTLESPDLFEPLRSMTDRSYLRLVPGLMRVLVEDGCTVTAQVEPDCDAVTMQNLILGIGLTMTGFQRGHIPLHASCVEVGGACVAFTGQSGAGKSTVAALLEQRGFAHHIDDLCLARLKHDQFIVGRGASHLRLWDDAVSALGQHDLEQLGVLPGIDKAVYRAASSDKTDLPLRRVYVLRDVDGSVPPGIARVEGSAALPFLLDGLRIAPSMLTVGAAQSHFLRLAELLRRVEFYTFTRPWDLGQYPRWIDLLVAHFESLSPSVAA